MEVSKVMGQRLRELASKIASERDPDKFTALVKELNELMDEENNPGKELPPSPTYDCRSTVGS
jgi:hypothetical protein